MAILVPKFWDFFLFLKSVFGYLKKIYKKKCLWPLSSRGGGGGKALVAGPLKKYRFFAASLTETENTAPQEFARAFLSLFSPSVLSVNILVRRHKHNWTLRHRHP